MPSLRAHTPLKETTAWPRRGLRAEAAAGKPRVGREGGGRAGLAQGPGQGPVVVSGVRRVRWATEARAFGLEARADPGVSQVPAHSLKQGSDWSGILQSFSQAAV